MTNLNLLSPEQKSELKIKRIYIAVKEIVMLLLLFTALAAILLISCRYILEEQLSSLVERNASAILINRQTDTEIVALNQKIDALDKVQNNNRSWSDFIRRLAAATTPNISFELLKIYRQNNIVEIQGKAATRQDLINLQKSLEDSKLFKSVNIPLSSLLARENSSFSIRAEIASP